MIDYDALSKIIEHVVNGGVDYLVVLGSTGESATLSADERRKVLDHVIAVNARTLPIVAGNFGGNNTSALVSSLSTFDFDGIDAILSSSPAYNKPGQEGIVQHYTALANVAPVPVILYNVPGRTSSNMTAETILRLSEHDNIIGVKEASADLVQGSHILKGRADDFYVLSGDDPTALPLTFLGGDGVISVVANLFPSQFSKMIRSARSGHVADAVRIHESLLDLHTFLYAEGNPTGLKAAMEIAGLCSAEVRLPLVEATDSLESSLRSQIEHISAL